MKRWQVKGGVGKCMVALGLLCATVAPIGVTSNAALAGGRGGGGTATGGAEQVVLQYFTDLAARRFTASHFLEAPCSHTVPEPPGFAFFHARNGWPPGSAQLEGQAILTIRATDIAPFHLPLLTHGHMQGFRLDGYFAFGRPTSPSGNPNAPRTFKRVAVFTWQCGSRWWVDPYWFYSSEQYGVPVMPHRGMTSLLSLKRDLRMIRGKW